MTHTCLFMSQVSWHFTGLGQIVTTCLECSLLEEQAVSQLLLHPALLLLRPTLRLLLSCWRQQCGHHLLPAQSFPLALLGHLQPEFIDHAVVAGPHVSVPDHSVQQGKQREVKVKRLQINSYSHRRQKVQFQFCINRGLSNNHVVLINKQLTSADKIKIT